MPDDDEHIWLTEPRIDLAPVASQAQVRELAEAVLQYRWATPDDGRRMMGWIVASIVGGALPWRPHIMLSAPASAGKSWFLRVVLERVMGRLMQRVADATPPAIARLTENASLPIAIDEAEPSSEWVMALFGLLRIAAGAEGARVRADTVGGGVIIQSPRFSALLSATAVPVLSQADASRLGVVRLGVAVDDWRQVRVRIQEAVKVAPAIRSLIIQSAPAIVAHAARLEDTFQELGVDSREALAASALTAGWQFWGVDNRDVFLNSEAQPRTDASDALMEILSLPIREGGAEQSVLEALMTTRTAGMAADSYGVRRIGDDLLIALPHQSRSRALFRTPWARVDLKRLLLELEGAEYFGNPRQFSKALRARGVLIPAKTLATLGINLEFSEEEEGG